MCVYVCRVCLYVCMYAVWRSLKVIFWTIVKTKNNIKKITLALPQNWFSILNVYKYNVRQGNEIGFFFWSFHSWWWFALKVSFCLNYSMQSSFSDKIIKVRFLSFVYFYYLSYFNGANGSENICFCLSKQLVDILYSMLLLPWLIEQLTIAQLEKAAPSR